MKLRHLLATLFLLPFAIDAVFHLYVKNDTAFARHALYDSALAAAGAYAQTDPAQVPDPSAIMLVALGAALLGLVMTRRTAQERDAA